MSGKQVMKLLVELEADMRRLGIWSATPPSADKFESQVPFFVDTMPFEQWLQFVLIPKMTALIAENQQLPTNVAISPMAEEALDIPAPAKKSIIKLIAELDSELTRGE